MHNPPHTRSVSGGASRHHGSLFFGIDNDGDLSETKLTERQQEILNLIKESPTITGKQMSEILSVSQRTIERDISQLKKMGILKHEGKDNDGMWVISD